MSAGRSVLEVSPGAAGPLLSDPAISLSWLDHGACIGHDPDMWFSGDGIDAARAKGICLAECPVRFQCLEYAVREDIPGGTWGGLDEAERRPLTEARARKCRNGLHLMDAENTYTAPDGTRSCKGCRRAAEAARRTAERIARTGDPTPRTGKYAA
jgi:WhiB family transcriptional regulator, redox-sensing transcriptional regulator